MNCEDNESLKQDQMALTEYEESRKRLRSTSCSPTSDTYNIGKIKKEKVDDKYSWEPTDNKWQNDPSGLYGLKAEYLRILGIEPPICNWVCVENFRCDKSELRDILELAGYVVACSMIYSTVKKHAKVMYSHPLEAVQAVSMLNKQMYYGSVLTVTMMKYPLDSIMLPKGLPNIGPGFGSHGKPLRDIASHYERFVNKKPNSLNTLLFHSPDDDDDDDETFKTVNKMSLEDIYGKFQFSKHIQIRNVEYDSDDSRTEKDSKTSLVRNENKYEPPNNTAVTKYLPNSRSHSPASCGKDSKSSLGRNENKYNSPNTTAVTKYSPKSRSHSPALSEGSKNDFKPNEVSIKQNFPANTSDVKYSWEKKSNDMASTWPSRSGSDGSIGLVSGQNNNKLLTPVGHGAKTNRNVATSSNGPRFGINPYANPTGVGYRPNFGPTGQPAMASNPPANPMTGGYRPNITAMAGPNVPMPNSNVPGPMMSGVRPTIANQFTPTNVTVQFRNLPPTTTFAVLSEKTSQCGQVMSLQLTTPGCATVSFSHPAHAQQCFQRLNNICVDGCIIQARIV